MVGSDGVVSRRQRLASVFLGLPASDLIARQYTVGKKIGTVPQRLGRRLSECSTCRASMGTRVRNPRTLVKLGVGAHILQGHGRWEQSPWSSWLTSIVGTMEDPVSRWKVRLDCVSYFAFSMIENQTQSKWGQLFSTCGSRTLEGRGLNNPSQGSSTW